jgi:sarcosine oxidase
VGLSAALALRDRGARPIAVDPGPPGGEQSAGPGRIFRHLHDLPRLVGLAVRAREGWRRAEERFGRPLLDGRGTLMIGGDRRAWAARLRAAGLPCHELGPEDLPAALPPLAPGLLDPLGGAIDAEGYVAALAHALGGSVRRARVDDLRVGGDVVSVVTDRGPVECDRVLVCAGAGAAGLAGRLGLRLPLAVAMHRRVTFRGGVDDSLPCLLERSGARGPTGYATPLPGGRIALGTGAADDLDERRAVELTRRWMEGLLPRADASPVGVVRCRSVVLAGHTEEMGLYRAGPVGIFAGGNLFKHAPALGPLLAEAITEDRIDPVLTPPEPPAP